MVELAPGKAVSHYRLEALLGEGGMGVVYRAHDTKLERTVALKFVRPELFDDADARQRFLREARALAALDHPNVGTVHGLEEEGELLFMVMTYIEGSSLHEVLQSRRPAPDEARSLMRKMAAGLRAAHDRGVIHRDLKSGNIMVTPDGEAKLVDFGLARHNDDTRMTQAGAIVGTLSFMSPEQLRGEELDHRSDIFSLGAVFYHLLTGEIPFDRGSHAATMHALMYDAPPAFDESLPEAVRDLEPLVRRCLEREVEDRFASVDEVLTALESGEAEEPRPVIKRLQRHQSRVVWGVVSLILVVAAGWLFFSRPTAVRTGAARATGAPTPTLRANALAVVAFDNISGAETLAWMERGVPELFSTALSRSEKLDVYDSRRLAALRGEQLPANGLDPAEMTELLRQGGIGRMIGGSIFSSGGRLRLEAKVVDVETGEIISSSSAQGDMDADVFSLCGELIGPLLIALEIKLEENRAGEMWLKEITTSSVEAYRAYLLGRAAFVESRWDEARIHYEAALVLDPDFLAPRLDLAGAYWNLGDGNSAKIAEQLERLHSMRDRATAREVLEIDLETAVIGEHPRDILRTARQLASLEPENRVYSYLQGRGHFLLEEYEQCIEVLRPLVDARWNWAWTYVLTGRSLQALGDTEAAAAIYELGMEITGNTPELAYFVAGLELEHGDPDAARSIFEDALRHPLLTETPEYEARIRLRLAKSLVESGEQGAAAEHFRRVVELAPYAPSEADEARHALETL